jgi:hypothetical protein
MLTFRIAFLSDRRTFIVSELFLATRIKNVPNCSNVHAGTTYDRKVLKRGRSKNELKGGRRGASWPRLTHF